MSNKYCETHEWPAGMGEPCPDCQALNYAKMEAEHYKTERDKLLLQIRDMERQERETRAATEMSVTDLRGQLDKLGAAYDEECRAQKCVILQRDEAEEKLRKSDRLLRVAEDALGPDRTPTDRKAALMELGKHLATSLKRVVSQQKVEHCNSPYCINGDKCECQCAACLSIVNF